MFSKIYNSIDNDKIKLKTTAKMLGPSHFVTLSDTEMFYIYIYKESDVKYFIQLVKSKMKHLFSNKLL